MRSKISSQTLPGAGWDGSRKQSYDWFSDRVALVVSLRVVAPAEEDILLRRAVDRHTPVGPWMEVMVPYRVAVIIIADIFRHDVRVRLVGKWADHAGEGRIRGPGEAAVGRLGRVHLVAQNSRASLDAGRGGIAFVVPHCHQAAICGDRKVRLPISFTTGIGVQLHRRAKGGAIIRGTDGEDVRRVGADLGVIDVVNDAG